MELTRAHRASSLAREDTSSSWTKRPERLRVTTPRLPPRGFFQNLAKNSRIASCTSIDESLRENVSRSGQKFLAPAEILKCLRTFSSSPITSSFPASQFFIKKYDSALELLLFLRRSRSAVALSSAVHRRARSSILKVIFPDTRDADSRSQRPALERHCTGCRP